MNSDSTLIPTGKIESKNFYVYIVIKLEEVEYGDGGFDGKLSCLVGISRYKLL